jgi:nitroimidazol reductase NimA-like FMN-containing flavoprotein (pyridoxamine 5'-phosphate oxidase superfamily)
VTTPSDKCGEFSVTEPPSDRTTIKRKPERAAYDRAAIDRVLDEGLICHVGFAVDGQTFVLPMIHVRVGDTVYLHGSPASRMLRALAQGAEACLTVTLLDGLVLARSALHHSMNYRSVVLFGKASVVDDPAEKCVVLKALMEHLIPARWADVRGPTERELQRTMVLSLPIHEASAKVRAGPPLDDEADYELPVWAGVVPLRVAAGSPIADPRLKPGLEPPGYALRYDGPQRVSPGEDA